MNSKEALEILYDGYQNGMAGRSFYDIIKQDLEVLEILKKWIVVGGTPDGLFPYEIKVKKGYISNKSSLVLTKEDFKKIKEWLEE